MDLTPETGVPEEEAEMAPQQSAPQPVPQPTLAIQPVEPRKTRTRQAVDYNVDNYYSNLISNTRQQQ